MSNAAPEAFSFQAEISQLLHILSHSLYQNREIALRELISNASDALNKLRHVQLTQEQYRDEQPLQITLVPNKDARTLTIQDNGVGLTRDELIQNLGTIAHSGSKEFLTKLADNAKGDLSLIGQFGVGFYSAFMLADKVEVVTRSYQEQTGWKWESDGSGRFTIEPVEGDTPRGAQIRLHLKADLEEFLEPHRLKGIVRRYSTFVPYPVQLEGEQLNSQSPIWVEPKSQVTPEQYEGFYQWLSHRSTEKPLWHLHLAADSPLQFQAILYCPASNMELLGFGRVEHGIHLCAKRILVQPDNNDLLPEYLHFLYGLVDSADLPLNVSRETLQDHQIIPKLKRVLTKKVLDHLADLAQEQPEQYRKFIDQFGSILRTGVNSDWDNREKIATLLRFHSTFGDDRTAVISLDDYLKRAAEGQTQIYYLTGLQRDALANHPRLAAFRKRNLEVLLLDDPVDEYALAQLGEYKEKKLVSIDSADVAFPSSTDPADENLPEVPKELPRVVELFRGALEDKVTEVKETSRLTDAPCTLTNPEGGYSRLLQTVISQQMKEFPRSKPILEVNPRAALIRRLAELSVNPANDDFIRDCAQQLFAGAQLLDGLNPDPQDTAARMQRFMEDLAQTKSSIIV
ncbi:MAG TPA: molecular chaperone HtpG, partial [Planctomycetaceae bacterium]|nr:molecular chaperone HtpG [Planctomycetaceae bacterium]